LLLFDVRLPAAGQPDKSAQFCDPSQLAALQERLAQHSKQDTTGGLQQQTQLQQQPHPQQQQHQQWHEQHSEEQQQQQPMDEGEGAGVDWQAEDAVPMSTSPGNALRYAAVLVCTLHLTCTLCLACSGCNPVMAAHAAAYVAPHMQQLPSSGYGTGLFSSSCRACCQVSGLACWVLLARVAWTHLFGLGMNRD
jgi:hypothetical protein